MNGEMLIMGILLPLCFGAFVAFTTRRTDPVAKPRNIWLIQAQLMALALGWSTSQMGFLGPIHYPVTSSDGLLRFQALIAVLLGLLGGALLIHKRRADQPIPATLLAAIIGAVSASVVLWRHLGSPDTATQLTNAATILAGALAAALLTWPLAQMASENRRVTTAAILAGILLASAAGLLGTGSESLARLTIGLALVCIGLLSVIIFMRTAAVAMITVATAAGGLVGPLAAGVLFSSMPHWVAALLVIAPLCGYLAGKLLGPRGGSALGATIRIAIPALIAAAAIAPGIIALIRFQMGDTVN